MSITSANSIYILSIPGVFGAPQQLQGFAADEIFATEPIEASETLMGVDGTLSAGFVYTPIKQTISLQADSASNLIFDTWYQSNLQAVDTFAASALITLPSLKRKYTMPKGFLQMMPLVPDARKILQPRNFVIIWERILFSQT